MDFGKKLSLLMNVLGVTNNILAKALSIDPSLVSRWRSGSRTPTKDGHYVEMIAKYMVDHAKMEHQRLAICEISGCGSKTDEDLVQAIVNWLLDTPMPDTRLIGGFLSKVGLFKASSVQMEKIDVPLEGQKMTCEIFYGNEGKQRGVMRFLSLAMRLKKPGTLLLYSDESVDWFLADRNYAFHLGETLIQLTKKGWKIKMIHTMSRNISEMLAAIDFWLSLYMTGSVMPYYNPKYHEHYFRRTLFVIPKLAAFTCSAFENFQRNAVNFLIAEEHIVGLLEEEYNQFLNTCRPLMEIPEIGSQEMFTLIEDFEEQPAPSYLIADGLPFVTMPLKVIENVLQKSKAHHKRIISHWGKRSIFFEKNLKDHSCVHILTLPSVESVKSGKVPVELPEPSFELFYSAQEYVEHLKYLLYLTKTYKNYHLCISQKNIDTNLHVAVKDQVGVIVFKKDQPIRLFAINHPDMTNAFYCYAEDFFNKLPEQSKDRKYVVQMLEKLIRDLKE